jgi:hypothetical protein
MIAALAVPVPGYQTPQVALTASGEVTTLVLPGFCEECADEAAEEAVTMEKTKGYIRQRKQISASVAKPEAVTAAVLTSKRRAKLSTSTFAIPEERKFPIHDESHARNALSRASGTKYESRVRRAVCKRYPNMGECGD